jgi:cytochrome c peroxidase
MKLFLICVSCAISIVHANNLNPQMQKYMNSLNVQAKSENSDFTNFSYARGEKIFTSEHLGKKGKPISCVSCHTTNLSKNGENISTGKLIKPLSPLTNNKRFTKVKNVKKWLRRNFRDVYKREGTAQEKGDVITYIINKR